MSSASIIADMILHALYLANLLSGILAQQLLGKQKDAPCDLYLLALPGPEMRVVVPRLVLTQDQVNYSQVTSLARRSSRS